MPQGVPVRSRLWVRKMACRQLPAILYIFVFYALKTLCSHCIITLYEIADALPFTKDKSVVVVLFTKVKPIDDIGNAILPEEVIKLSY